MSLLVLAFDSPRWRIRCDNPRDSTAVRENYNQDTPAWTWADGEHSPFACSGVGRAEFRRRMLQDRLDVRGDKTMLEDVIEIIGVPLKVDRPTPIVRYSSTAR
jgi:hypothetical protein